MGLDVVKLDGLETLVKPKALVKLDGASLSPETLVQLQNFETEIDLTEEAWAEVGKSREVIDRVLRDGRTVYGINTGFGKFCRVLVSPEKLEELQQNLITSHSCGVGHPIQPKRARMLMALRINVLAKRGIKIRKQIFACIHGFLRWF